MHVLAQTHRPRQTRLFVCVCFGGGVPVLQPSATMVHQLLNCAQPYNPKTPPDSPCVASPLCVRVSALCQIGWICQTVVVFGVPYDPDTFFAPSGVGKAFFWIFALLPWCPLSKSTMDLAAATNTDKSPGGWPWARLISHFGGRVSQRT